MHTVRLMFMALLLLAMVPAQASDWSDEDVARQTVFTVLMVADARQTQDISRHVDIHESNPLLGPHPGNEKINLYFTSMAALHLLIADQLDGKARRNWQAFWIAVEIGYVANNARIGLRWSI